MPTPSRAFSDDATCSSSGATSTRARRGGSSRSSARASTSRARVSRVSRSDSRAITSRNSSRAAGSSFAPVRSISTAVTIEASGVRSSWAAFVANSRWTRSLRSRWLSSKTTTIALSPPFAGGIPDTTSVLSSVTTRSCSGRSAAKRSTARPRIAAGVAVGSPGASSIESSSRARSFAYSTLRSRSTSSTPSFSLSSRRSSRSRSLSSDRKSSLSCALICSIESARLPTSSGNVGATRTSKSPAPISLAVRAMRPRRRAVRVAISRPSAAPTPKAIRADSTYSVWITPRRCRSSGRSE